MEYRSCAALSLALAVLGGCSTLAPDGGFAPVAATVQGRAGAATRLVRTQEDAASARAFVDSRLATPVTPDAAVEIALVNNPGLQARYADLGIAEAQLVQAGRLPNPRFSFSHLGSGDTLEIERRFAVDVMSVLVMPLTLKLERGRFDVAQTAAAVEALQVAAVLHQGQVVSLDSGVALSAAQLGVAHKLPLADSIVYATAKQFDATVWTMDADFEGLPSVRYVPKRK